MEYLSEKNRAIFSQIVRADFKLKYQGSVLGYLWSLLRPLLMFLVLYVIFGVILKVGGAIPHYPIYLLLGIVLWTLFAETTQNGLQAIVAREDLIKKIKIPRWVVVISTGAASLISLIFSFVVVIIFALINGMPFLLSSPIIIFYILEIYFFALGLSLLLSAAYVKYRDISYIWDVVIQAGFYATPILYPLNTIKDVAIQKILILNPVAHAIQEARDVFVTHDTLTIGTIYGSPYAWMIPVGIVALTFVIGVSYFKKQAPYFAENL